MKQNERLLVYAVTGFLAVILVIAVVFGREPGREGVNPAKPTGLESQGLTELLDPDAGKGPTETARTVGATGLPTPSQVAPLPASSGQPLVAGGKSMLAADLLAQQLGPNRRDRTVRFVRARPGDSLESLVRRWCGVRDPFLAEAKYLNEDLVGLRAGQEVGVPWVDDDAVLAALEAQKPRLLAAAPADAIGEAMAGLDPALAIARPSFAEPGSRTPANSASASLGSVSAPSSGTTYTVKSGDSLWRIAERTYGRQNADRMVGEIRQANPGVGERLPVGQKLVLPAK